MCATGAVLAVAIAISVYEVHANPQQVPAVPLRGPPVVEKAPLLLSSFLPASMQIIAHLTDLMKYELRPATGTTTTTTVRPTPSHDPGVYSPRHPPGPAAYFSRGSAYQEYIERLQNSQGLSYFDRYKYPVEGEDDLEVDPVEPRQQGARAKLLRGTLIPELENSDLNLLGPELNGLLQQVNRLEDYDFVDDDDALLKFADNYDDLTLKNYIVGNKKVPPTKAYVTLLSLYDLLNKESKKLLLNKYGGYAEEILQVLADTSTGTAADQLKTVLNKIVQRRDTKDQQILQKMRTLVNDLEKSDSYLNDALRYIPPLQFIL